MAVWCDCSSFFFPAFFSRKELLERKKEIWRIRRWTENNGSREVRFVNLEYEHAANVLLSSKRFSSKGIY